MEVCGWRNCQLQNHSARSLLSAFTPGDLISHCSHSNESLAIASRPQWHIWLTVCSSKAVLWTFGRLKARSQQSFQLRCTAGREDIARYWYILAPCRLEQGKPVGVWWLGLEGGAWLVGQVYIVEDRWCLDADVDDVVNDAVFMYMFWCWC